MLQATNIIEVAKNVVGKIRLPLLSEEELIKIDEDVESEDKETFISVSFTF